MIQWLKNLFAPISPRLALGNRGELVAARHLRRRGHKILMRNFRTRGGEIDIVAREGDILVFVEVKTSGSDDGSAPHQRVTPAKQHRLTLAARSYIANYDVRPSFRFDVVSIVWVEGRRPEIEHIRNAFAPTF